MKIHFACIEGPPNCWKAQDGTANGADIIPVLLRSQQ
jgi:hypothetical protein